MASRDFDATTVPQDVVAAAGLTAGTAFAGQNLSTTATLFLLIRDSPLARVYVLYVFCVWGSRSWGSRLHRACVV